MQGIFVQLANAVRRGLAGRSAFSQPGMFDDPEAGRQSRFWVTLIAVIVTILALGDCCRGRLSAVVGFHKLSTTPPLIIMNDTQPGLFTKIIGTLFLLTGSILAYVFVVKIFICIWNRHTYLLPDLLPWLRAC